MPNDANDRKRTAMAMSAEPLWRRAIFMVIFGAMLSFAQSILVLIAIVQFVIILIDRRQPNAGLAEFGRMVGAWVADAAGYLSVATDNKPWPFHDKDWFHDKD